MQRLPLVILTAFLAFAFLSCASGGGSSGSTSEPSSSSTAAAKPPQGGPAPAGSKLAQVKSGMTAAQVNEILGHPTSQRSYPTGKAFMPWYFGSDATRTDYKYKGVGRVVFSHNRWSGAMSVVRVDYDPNESGS